MRDPMRTDEKEQNNWKGREFLNMMGTCCGTKADKERVYEVLGVISRQEGT